MASIFVSGIVEKTNGEVLVVRLGNVGEGLLAGEYVFPAGTIKEQMSPEQFIVKRIKQASSLDAVVKTLLGARSRRFVKGINSNSSVSLWYLCRPTDEAQNPVPSGFTTEAMYVPRSEVTKLITIPRIVNSWADEVTEYFKPSSTSQ
jgi:hypothetical protein